MCKNLNERVAMAAQKYPEFKGLLSEIVPDAFKFDYKSIKSYDDAVQIRPVDDEDCILNTDSKDIIAYKKLKHLRKTICPGYKPNWLDCNEAKYYPYFDVQRRSESCSDSRSSNSGFGFRNTNYDCNYVLTRSGSRLCLPSEELAIYFGKTFTKYYEDWLMY